MLQCPALKECLISDRYKITVIGILHVDHEQFFILVKSRISYRSHLLRDSNLQKSRTAVEGFISDCL